MSRTFDTLSNDTVDIAFDNLGPKVCGNCRGRSSSPHRCCADPVKRSSHLSSKVCMLRKHALCPSYGGLISSLLSGKDAGFQWLDASVIFFMCHALIVTNEAAIAQLGERLTEIPKVRSSALALCKAPVGAAPNFQRAHCQSSAELLQELLSRSSHGRLHCNVCNALKCSDLRRIRDQSLHSLPCPMKIQ